LRHAPSRHVPPIDALRTYLGSLPTQTAISSAIRVLVRLLLLYTARSRRASHLLLGTSLTTLSVSLISCISQGGGHSIHEEFQEEWDSGILTTNENTDAIRVVRPLRDVTMKECSLFAWWNSIHVVGRDRQTRATAGIPGLTKGTEWLTQFRAFLTHLLCRIYRRLGKRLPVDCFYYRSYLCQIAAQKYFARLLRTLSAVSVPLLLKGNRRLKVHRPIQEGLDVWKSRISIRSYSDTKVGSDLVYLPTPVPSNSSDVFTTSDQHPSISTHLCYSCRTMLTSRSSRASRPTPSGVIHSDQPPPSAPLPSWVAASCAQPRTQDKQIIVSGNGELWVRKPQDEATQRNKIADFLLNT